MERRKSPNTSLRTPGRLWFPGSTHAPRGGGEASWAACLVEPQVFFALAFLLGGLSRPFAATAAEGNPHSPDPKPAGFVRLGSSETGVRFTNVLSASCYITNFLYLNGSGVALGDVDHDGLCDLFLPGIGGQSAFFHNLGGWKFENQTQRAGLALEGLPATGAAFADVDGDGDVDLLVNTMGQGTHVFLNNGKGIFSQKPDSQLNPGKAGMSMALADFDGNGTLDLYIANYRTDSIRDRPNARFEINQASGKPVVAKVDGKLATDPSLIGRFELSASGQIVEHGEADVFYRNDGKGRFTLVSFTEGTFLDDSGKPLSSPPYDWGLSVMARDLNGDGYPDLYVCNDFESPDRIWLNDGHGRFRPIDKLAIRHSSIFSMGMDAGDLNRDGADDLVVSDMLMQTHASRHLRIGDVPPVFQKAGVFDDRPQYSFNTLQLNRGDGTYAEVAWYAGLQASGWTWCPVLLDVDLDGYEDVLFSTGHQWDMMNADVINHAETLKSQRKLAPAQILQLRTLFNRFNTPNVVFRNRGNLTFEDKSAAWGFTDAEVSQGIALADLDNDGDLDLVVNNLNGEAALYRNECAAPHVAVRLKGTAPNTRGIGAKILVRGGAVPLQSQEVICGGRYLSSDEGTRVFAAGRLTNRMELEVRWRSGKRTVLSGITANRTYEIDEAVADSPALSASKGVQGQEPPWFEDRTRSLNHVHHEEPFDDFARQPLLPRKLSQLGPGLCWTDLDGDGLDELVVGSGRGGTIALFRNEGQGRFSREQEGYLSRPLGRDLTTILSAEGAVLAGSSNYEDGLTNGGCIRIYDVTRHVAGDSVMGQLQSTGPMAMADIDNDGDLDLFIGGRVLPGRYPEAADSLLLRNENSRFIPSLRFGGIGLVSGVVFTDLNQDSWPDLVLACDWGPVRVFLNQKGAFSDATESFGLGSLKGWWNSVSSGDFDGDGRMDLVAGNWGRNNRFTASAAHPRRIYFGDIDQDNVIDILEAADSAETGIEVPDRGFRMMSMALPWLRSIVPGYEAYANASLAGVYGDRLKSTQRLDVTTLASIVFLNRGGHFEPNELPADAQISPVFGIAVGDLDGDGNEDLFLAQNFFAVPPDEVRQDAGRGLWLRGNGKGGFQPVPGRESGIAVYGEQRGCALSDYDADGRVDLAVAQNGSATVLYHNVRAKPGLRVRLQGAAGNRAAFGAVLRLKGGDTLGPARELHAGAGYWSQDSAIQVLSSGGSATGVEVRWPGGKTTVSTVPGNAREVSIKPNGELTVVQ